MKLTYYGTAAGEAFPGVFCRCPICQEARRLGGKNIRTRSQALVNDDLLLDLPADNYLHTLYYGLDLSKVNHLLFTHSHSDHCYPEDLELLREPYSHTRSGEMAIWGNESVARRVREMAGSYGGGEYRFRFNKAIPNHPFTTGDYEVMPLRATHAWPETCLFYCIRQGDKTLLYAHDTGALTEENMASLKAMGTKLNLVSLDCTQQKIPEEHYHMGFEACVKQKAKLLAAGLADENTIWVVNHFSHNGGWLHEELCSHAEPEGFIASYDGLVIEF